MERIAAAIPYWLSSLTVVAIAFGAALIAHWLLLAIARRAVARSETSIDDIVLRRLRSPFRWLLIAFALTAVQPALPLSESGLVAWSRIAALVIPALIGWIAVALLGVAMDIVKLRADISVADNVRARRRRTRADILHRIGVFLVLLVTFCMMLMSIPSVRDIGVTLIASAGLAALAIGAAAQPALKNLIAGLQMAFTEPIAIDDVVVVEGEWGRIEEIRLTYVVVKTWDERRLVVPVSRFLDESFQNWTRNTSQIVGNVTWHLDPTADIPRLRAELETLVRQNERWDGRFCNLQVTQAGPEAIEVRALMTARDASSAFDLRCEVREAMLAFIAREMPEAIVRSRGELGFSPGHAA
jgi:small-conductance mechanosensitive channel